MKNNKFKKGQFVRVAYGCVWLYGKIDEICENEYYECSYGSKREFDKHKDGWPLDRFAHFHESDIKKL